MLEKQLATYLRPGDFVILDAARAREQCPWVKHHFAEQYIVEFKMKEGKRYEISQTVPIVKPGEGTILGWGIKIKGDTSVIGQSNYPHLDYDLDRVMSEGIVHEYFTIDQETKVILERRRASTQKQRWEELSGATNVDDLV